MSLRQRQEHENRSSGSGFGRNGGPERGPLRPIGELKVGVQGLRAGRGYRWAENETFLLEVHGTFSPASSRATSASVSQTGRLQSDENHPGHRRQIPVSILKPQDLSAPQGCPKGLVYGPSAESP